MPVTAPSQKPQGGNSPKVHGQTDGRAECGLSAPWGLTRTKEGSTGVCYDRDEPGKWPAKCKKPDAKGHTLDDSAYVKYPEQVSPRRQNARLMVVAGGLAEGNAEQLLHGYERKSQQVGP